MKYLFLSIFCLALNSAWGQRLDTGKYNHMVDFVDCKISEYLLNSEQQAGFKTECPCTINTDEKAVQSFLMGKGRTDLIDLSAEVQWIKNDLKGIRSTNRQDFFTKSIFLRKYRYGKLFAFYQNHNYDNAFPALIAGIRDTIAVIAGTDYALLKPAKSNNRILHSAFIAQENMPFSEDTTALPYQIGAFCISFTLLCTIILYLVLRSYKRAILNQVGTGKDGQVQKVLPQKAERRSQPDYEYIIFELKENIKSLSQRLRQIENGKIDNVLIEVVNPENTVPRQPAIEKEPEVTAREVFYLPTPDADGSFDIHSVTGSYNEGSSIYRVTRLTATRAQFQLHDHVTSMRLALEQISLRIIPCCISADPYDPNLKRIRVVKPGVMELQGNKWKVLEKSEIRYDNTLAQGTDQPAAKSVALDKPIAEKATTGFQQANEIKAEATSKTEVATDSQPAVVKKSEIKYETSAAITSTRPVTKTIPVTITNPSPPAKPIEVSPREIFYLPAPDRDGNFDVKGVTSEYKDGVTLYRVTKSSATAGEFQIDNHDVAVREALHYASLVIDPCCISANTYNRIFKKINTKQPGLMELKGNKWVVIKKSEIRYEN